MQRFGVLGIIQLFYMSQTRRLEMFRKKIYALSFVVFLTSNTCIASDKTLKYVSPGLRIGYEFGRGLTIGFKFSFGINTDYDFNNSAYYWVGAWDSCFITITIKRNFGQQLLLILAV